MEVTTDKLVKPVGGDDITQQTMQNGRRRMRTKPQGSPAFTGQGRQEDVRTARKIKASLVGQRSEIMIENCPVTLATCYCHLGKSMCSKLMTVGHRLQCPEGSEELKTINVAYFFRAFVKKGEGRRGR